MHFSHLIIALIKILIILVLFLFPNIRVRPFRTVFKTDWCAQLVGTPTRHMQSMVGLSTIRISNGG